MATWPASGNTDWNTKMLAYLAIEHNTDGTHAIKWPINGTGTRIYTKYFTGTLDSDSETSVAHSIAGIDNILSVTVSCKHSNGAYYSSDVRASASAANSFGMRYTATNVVIETVGSGFQGRNYRIKIDYTV